MRTSIVILLFHLVITLTARNHVLHPGLTDNYTGLVRNAMEKMRPGDSLIFEHGEYVFKEESARDMALYPSNNTGGKKNVVFPIVGKRDICIDGRGSTFVFEGSCFPFALIDSRQVTLQGFTITTRFPAAVDFTLIEKRQDGFKVRMGPATRYTTDNEGNISFSTGGREVSSRDGRISIHEVDRINICYLMTPQSKGDKDEFPAGFVGVKAKDDGEQIVDFTYYGDPHPKSIPVPIEPGRRVVLNLAEKREQIACFADGCEDLRIRKIHVRRFGGMAFVAQRCKDVCYEAIDVWPEANEAISVTADVFQCINCEGQVTLRQSRAGASLDDVINIHGNYLAVVSAKGRQLRLKACHLQHEGFFPYRKGDSIEIVDQHTRKVLAKARVRRLREDENNRFECLLTVDKDLSGISQGALVENITLCPEIIIEDNRLEHFPHIRLSGRGRMMIARNHISSFMGALLANDLADYWYEAGRFSQITIRENELTRCNELGGTYVFQFGVSGWGPDAPKIHGKVTLENNRYSGMKEKYVASGVREFIDRDKQ